MTLLVWTVFLHLKAFHWSVTVVREGMSVDEDRVIRNTFQSDGTRITECFTVYPFCSECSEFRQLYSSVHLIITTLHDQFSWFILLLETECSITKLNGSQFRQVYLSFSLQAIHSQTPHENNYWMHIDHTEVISNWACLFIISFFQNHSSIPMNHNWNWNSLHSILPFQSPPKKAHSQSHTRNNQRRNNGPSSILSTSYNSSNRNDDLDRTKYLFWRSVFQSPLLPIDSIQSTSLLPQMKRSNHPLQTPSDWRWVISPIVDKPYHYMYCYPQSSLPHSDSLFSVRQQNERSHWDSV